MIKFGTISLQKVHCALFNALHFPSTDEKKKVNVKNINTT
jgi:hypothetical protein